MRITHYCHYVITLPLPLTYYYFADMPRRALTLLRRLMLIHILTLLRDTIISRVNILLHIHYYVTFFHLAFAFAIYHCRHYRHLFSLFLLLVTPLYCYMIFITTPFIYTMLPLLRIIFIPLLITLLFAIIIGYAIICRRYAITVSPLRHWYTSILRHYAIITIKIHDGWYWCHAIIDITIFRRHYFHFHAIFITITIISPLLIIIIILSLLRWYYFQHAITFADYVIFATLMSYHYCLSHWLSLPCHYAGCLRAAAVDIDYAVITYAGYYRHGFWHYAISRYYITEYYAAASLAFAADIYCLPYCHYIITFIATLAITPYAYCWSHYYHTLSAIITPLLLIFTHHLLVIIIIVITIEYCYYDDTPLADIAISYSLNNGLRHIDHYFIPLNCCYFHERWCLLLSGCHYILFAFAIAIISWWLPLLASFITLLLPLMISLRHYIITRHADAVTTLPLRYASYINYVAVSLRHAILFIFIIFMLFIDSDTLSPLLLLRFITLCYYYAIITLYTLLIYHYCLIKERRTTIHTPSCRHCRLMLPPLLPSMLYYAITIIIRLLRLRHWYCWSLLFTLLAIDYAIIAVIFITLLITPHLFSLFIWDISLTFSHYAPLFSLIIVFCDAVTPLNISLPRLTFSLLAKIFTYWLLQHCAFSSLVLLLLLHYWVIIFAASFSH